MGGSWDEELADGREVLTDAGLFLASRQELDRLALEVLTADGVAEPEVGRLREFIDVEWPGSVQAYARLSARDEGGGRA